MPELQATYEDKPKATAQYKIQTVPQNAFIDGVQKVLSLADRLREERKYDPVIDDFTAKVQGTNGFLAEVNLDVRLLGPDIVRLYVPKSQSGKHLSLDTIKGIVNWFYIGSITNIFSHDDHNAKFKFANKGDQFEVIYETVDRNRFATIMFDSLLHIPLHAERKYGQRLRPVYADYSPEQEETKGVLALLAQRMAEEAVKRGISIEGRRSYTTPRGYDGSTVAAELSRRPESAEFSVSRDRRLKEQPLTLRLLITSKSATFDLNLSAKNFGQRFTELEQQIRFFSGIPLNQAFGKEWIVDCAVYNRDIDVD